MPGVIEVIVAAIAIASSVGFAAGAGFLLGSIVSALAPVIVGAAVSFGVSALAAMLSKKQSSPALDFAKAALGRSDIIRSSVENAKIIYGQVKASGPLLFVSTRNAVSGGRVATNGYLHLIIALACHEVQEIGDIYINDDLVTLDGSNFVNHDKYKLSGVPVIRIFKHTGSIDQTADTVLVEQFPTTWSTNHRLRGIAYVHVEMSWEPKIFTNGYPNFSFVVKGKKDIYDPRSATSGYTTNAALVCRDYLKGIIDYGDTEWKFGFGATDSELNDTTFIAAANICDEDVTLVAGTTQDRYTVNGVIDSGVARIENLDDLTGAMAGVCAYSQGTWRCHAGAYETPTISIDESWLAGDIEIQAKAPKQDLFNAVKGVYVDITKGWQPTDFPPVTNSTYETQDGGQRIERDIKLAYTTHVEAAQRIAKIILEKARQGIIVKMPCNMKALQVAVYEVVSVSIDYAGWDLKPFRVLKWEINTEGGITLILQEESSASYDWAAGSATLYDPAPDTNLPDANDVDAPGVPTITEGLYSTTDGSGLKVKADLSWGESDDAFVSHYEISYRLSADTDWIYATTTQNAYATIFDIEPGIYDFSITALRPTGEASAAALKEDFEIVGLTAAPANISGLTLMPVGNNAHLKWTAHTDLDVLQGGHIIVRHYPATSGAVWGDSIILAEDIPGHATEAAVPLKLGTYMLKAVDSSGNMSASATVITTDFITLLTLNSIFTQNEGTAFSGTKTNMVADGTVLKLDGSGLFDAHAGNFDDASGLFDAGGGGYQTTGSYETDNEIDLGAVYRVKVDLTVTFTVENAGALWDTVASNWDDVEGLFDGNDLGGITVKTYIRTTPDDPNGGSPTWTDWIEWVTGEISARGIDYKLTVASDDSTLNLNITQFSCVVDAPERNEVFSNQAIASGGTTLTYAKAFYTIPAINATWNQTDGDTVKYTHVTSGGKYTGVTVNFYNAGAVGRTIDRLVARGY